MAMCGLGDVVCDMRMSCGTSCATDEILLGNFVGTHCFVQRPL